MTVSSANAIIHGLERRPPDHKLHDGVADPHASRELVLPRGSTLAEKPDMSHCYLVESGLIATYITLERTPQTCVGLLGPGALIGWGFAIDCPYPTYRAITVVELLAVPTPVFREAVKQALEEIYLAQLHERLAQSQFVAACNAQHGLSERCAQWLLRLQEYFHDVIPVTHAFLAELLGVRRAGVSVTLETLQRQGVIRLQRGAITVLDPSRLRLRACPCTDSNSRISLSAALIGNEFPAVDTARSLIEWEIRMRINETFAADEGWKRREAALRACNAIVTQGSRAALSQTAGDTSVAATPERMRQLHAELEQAHIVIEDLDERVIGLARANTERSDQLAEQSRLRQAAELHAEQLVAELKQTQAKLAQSSTPV